MRKKKDIKNLLEERLWNLYYVFEPKREWKIEVSQAT